MKTSAMLSRAQNIFSSYAKYSLYLRLRGPVSSIYNILNGGKCKTIVYLSLTVYFPHVLLSDFINLTQVHNFTVSAKDIFTFRRLSVFTVSFMSILQVLMQIMKRFALYY